MSIASYSDLTSAVDAWLGHTLVDLQVSSLVQIFEAAANRRILSRQMETTSTLTPDSSGNATLPTDYLAWRRVTWTGSPRTELTYVVPDYFQAAYPSRPVDIPRFFTISGSTLSVMPLDSTGLEFNYFQKIPSLQTNSTNWLCTAYPDLYLFGTLAEAEAFLVNDERVPMWKARRDEIFEEITRLDLRTRGPSSIRVFGRTP